MTEHANRHQASHHDSHGHTVAAWTAVSVIIVGFMVGAVGIVAARPAVFWMAVGIVVIGIASGKLLSVAGFGSLPSYTEQAPANTRLEGPDM